MVRPKVVDLHWKNLLAIWDVLVDIEEARQMDPDRTVFPLLPKIVKFVELMPADSIGLRDNYCESRWRAVKYLERIGVVRNVSPREGNHRWATYIELIPDPSEFPVFYKEVEAEYAKRTGSQEAARSSATAKGGARVFVVHGRDLRLRDGMFTFLRSVGLEPIEWIEAVTMTGKSSPYIGEILETAFSNAQAIVVMLTGDDEAKLRAGLCQPKEPVYETEPTPQARPNVLFEAGMAMAYNPDRTVLVEFGNLRPFSDVAGRHSVKMDGSTEKRQELAVRLEKAGCPVRLTGTDWQKLGDLRAHLSEGTPSWSLSPQTKAEPVEVRLSHRCFRKSQDLHEYRLEVALINRGTDILEQYFVEVQFPRAYLEQSTSHSHEIKERNTESHRFFRVTNDPVRRPLFPGDPVLVYSLDYFIDKNLYLRRNGRFDDVVRVTAYVPGRQPSSAERNMKELQMF